MDVQLGRPPFPALHSHLGHCPAATPPWSGSGHRPAASPPCAETTAGVLGWWGGRAHCEAALSLCLACALPDLLSALCSQTVWGGPAAAGGQEPWLWAWPEGPLDTLAEEPIAGCVGGLPFPR